MDNDYLKKNCAKEALRYVEDNMIIGLGGGSTISYLINYIKESKLNIKVVTPSSKTRILCINDGLEVLHTSSVDRISVAFDGCDEVDESLNALKSGGGIHTKEKLIASMADDYILLVDESKFFKKLKFNHPVVLEILEDALKYVEKKVIELGGTTSVRSSSIKDGFTITENGNILMDVNFSNVSNIESLEKTLKNICGVIETSIFTNNIVTKVIITNKYESKVISEK
ncbi:ribose 5-phosphate isomerase A [uncultured Clostridium sp.]|uniref:ribose 5-phosphate isomerase A n=1 Tax=uncultured Clostridium sp. TaxID=59620 RepID=UPI0028E1D786|nr:ribose 5-phosphate isomerase A [uncultured Clostridium sp.]